MAERVAGANAEGPPYPHEEDRDSDKQRLLKELKSYPGTFNLYSNPGVSAVTPSKWTSILSKLEAEKDDSYDTEQELIQSQNFRVFLHTRLGQRNEAKEVNDAVLEKDQKNVSALVAKGILLCLEHNTVEAQRIADQLRQMQKEDADFPSLQAQAEGDEAYAYSRMGLRFCKFSIEKFESALRNCQDNKDLRTSLKFGFALTVRRSLHMASSFYKPHRDEDECEKRVKTAVEYLQDIAWDETLKKSLRAKAIVDTTQIYFTKNYPHLQFIQEAVDKGFKKKTSSRIFSPETLIEQALKLAPDDIYVLEFSAKFYRVQKKNYAKARELCEQAILKGPTARAYTFLGLVHQKLAWNRAATQQGRRLFRDDYAMLCDSHKNPILLDPNDDDVKAAIENFKKALGINPSDFTTYQKLGSILRRTGDYDSSIEWMRKMLDQTINTPTPLDQMAAFEIMGECYLEKKRLAEKEGNQVQMRHCSVQAESMFMKAISAACDAVRAIPGFAVENSLASFANLEKIILTKEGTTSTDSRYRELADLYRCIGRYSESLGFLKKLCEQDPEELQNLDTQKSLIWSYSKNGDHDEAFESLQLLSFTGHAENLMKDDVFVREICFGALERFVQRGDKDLSRNCVHCLLQLCGSPAWASRDEDGFDLFVLHEEEDDMEDAGGEVQAVLAEWCGFRVTRNSRDVLPGCLELTGQVELMHSARGFLVLLGPRPVPPSFFLDQALWLRTEGRPLAVLAAGEAEVPAQLAAERRAACPPAQLLRERSPYVLRCFLRDVLAALLP